jgi:vacuolar protein sorting-associated protein 13A/C
MLGGMNIIGNPKEFLMEIRTGADEYNNGIVRGTGGLLRGVTAGAANAVSKIMGSIGNGIGSLSQDDQYLTEREIMKQKQINGFMDGLSSSGMSIYKGIESGITGLVRQPYQGMKEEGFFGAIKGSLKGIAGLITKPLIGIIDATSKTA